MVLPSRFLGRFGWNQNGILHRQLQSDYKLTLCSGRKVIGQKHSSNAGNKFVSCRYEADEKEQEALLISGLGDRNYML